MWKVICIDWSGANILSTDYACMQKIVTEIGDGSYKGTTPLYVSEQDYLIGLQKIGLIKNWQLTIVSADRYDINVGWEYNSVNIIWGWRQEVIDDVTLNDIKF